MFLKFRNSLSNAQKMYTSQSSYKNRAKRSWTNSKLYFHKPYLLSLSNTCNPFSLNFLIIFSHSSLNYIALFPVSCNFFLQSTIALLFQCLHLIPITYFLCLSIVSFLLRFYFFSLKSFLVPYLNFRVHFDPLI